jgi:hypothetical protein
MGIDQAVKHVDREIRTAKDALAKAAARTERTKVAFERARADQNAVQLEVDRLVSAKALLTGRAPARTGAGRPSGEDRKLYGRFLDAIERMEPDATCADLRATLGISAATMAKYLGRAQREGRVSLSGKRRRGSPILVRHESAVVDISMRRSA